MPAGGGAYPGLFRATGDRLSPNTVQHLRGQGQLPKPSLDLENRFLYLRHDVEGYMVGRRQARAAAIAKDLAEKLAHLPQDQVNEIMRLMTSERAV